MFFLATRDDFEAWVLWMSDVVDPETGNTWDSWNKAQLEKPRNDRGTQTNKLATAVRGVLGAVPTAVLTLGAVTNLQDTRWNKWIVFGVITGTFWAVCALLVFTYRWLMVGHHYRIWRLIRTTAVVALLAFFICACIFVPSVGSGIGLRNIVLIIFANFSVRATWLDVSISDIELVRLVSNTCIHALMCQTLHPHTVCPCSPAVCHCGDEVPAVCGPRLPDPPGRRGRCLPHP